MGERGEAARRWLIAQVRSENCVGLRADRPRDVRSRYVLDRLKRFPKKRNSGEKEKKSCASNARIPCSQRDSFAFLESRYIIRLSSAKEEARGRKVLDLSLRKL